MNVFRSFGLVGRCITLGGAVAIGGRVKGLEGRDLFGERVLVFRDQKEVLASADERRLADLARKEVTRTSHSAAGLLTRRRDPSDPLGLVDFAVTLRPAPELDREWTVIGRLEKDDDIGFVDKINTLPIYAGVAVGDFSESTPFAARVFKAERNAFRGVATAIGDSRVSNVFPGKILRRVEVTQTELLP